MLTKHEMMRLAWYVLNVPEEEAQRKLDALPIEDASAVLILSTVYHSVHQQAIEEPADTKRKIGFSMGKDESAEEGKEKDVSED
jgi:hypothetical protein